MGDRRGAYRVCWGDLMEKNHLEEQRVDGRIILKWIFKKWDGETCVYSSGSEKGQAVGICGSDNEPSAAVKCRKFLD
jgi:hypothetical protein